jgi:hypothetical protein
MGPMRAVAGFQRQELLQQAARFFAMPLDCLVALEARS